MGFAGSSASINPPAFCVQLRRCVLTLKRLDVRESQRCMVLVTVRWCLPLVRAASRCESWLPLPPRHTNWPRRPLLHSSFLNKKAFLVCYSTLAASSFASRSALPTQKNITTSRVVIGASIGIIISRQQRSELPRPPGRASDLSTPPDSDHAVAGRHILKEPALHTRLQPCCPCAIADCS